MMRTAIPSVLCFCWLATGCATTVASPSAHLGDADERALSPRGPGAVFASVDEAAVDGLLTAFFAGADERGAERRARGGIVRPVAGGFSYGPLSVASPELPGRVELHLSPSDVAIFHTSVSAVPAGDRPKRRPLAQDRHRFECKSGERTSYVLAPRLRVWRCEAGASETLVLRIPSDLKQRVPAKLVWEAPGSRALRTAQR